MVKDSARYAKIVEWSEDDECYVGSAPGLIYGGCHGSDERAVFDELCRIVEEAVELYRRDGKSLPPPMPSRNALLEEAVRGLRDVRDGRVAAARQVLAKHKVKRRR